MHDTHLTITALILLLLRASCVEMITKWVRVPYTVALVVVGLVTRQLHFLPAIHISPELILLIFLPALLFEASWNLEIADETAIPYVLENILFRNDPVFPRT